MDSIIKENNKLSLLYGSHLKSVYSNFHPVISILYVYLDFLCNTNERKIALIQVGGVCSNKQ